MMKTMYMHTAERIVLCSKIHIAHDNRVKCTCNPSVVHAIGILLVQLPM